MFRLLAVVLFAAHLVLIRSGSRLRWIFPVFVGGPAALMILTYWVIGSEENRDLLYILPIWAMTPLVLAELTALTMDLLKRFGDKN